MLGPAFAWFRLLLFAVLLIVLSVLERWVLVAIIGACLVWVLVRAVRAGAARSELADVAYEPSVAISRPRDVDANRVVPETSEPIERPVFEMSPATVSAIRRRGGNLYIWNDKASLLRARATASTESITYNTFLREGCSIHIDGDFDPGERWVIQWKRLPWPHFRALYDPVAPSTGGDIISGILEALLWK